MCVPYYLACKRVRGTWKFIEISAGCFHGARMSHSHTLYRRTSSCACARALCVVRKDSSYDVVLVVFPKKLSLCGELCPLMTVGSAFYSLLPHFAYIALLLMRRAPDFSREIDSKMLISIALINDRVYPPENGAKLSAMTEPNPAKELRDIKVGHIIKHVTHTTTCYLHCLVLATNRSTHKKKRKQLPTYRIHSKKSKLS